MTTYSTTREATERRLPWDAMGSALRIDGDPTLDEALATSGLDYELKIEPVWAGSNIGELKPAPKARAIVRPGPEGDFVVGVTGKRFTPIQNRDGFKIAEEVRAMNAGRIVGMADFREGAASLMVLALDNDVELRRPDGGIDRLQLNLLTKNAHDGSSALTLALTAIRPDCTNALQMSLDKAERVWKVSHTTNAQDRVRQAEEAIKMAIAYRSEVIEVAQSMLDTKIIDEEFAKIVEGLWPVPFDERSRSADNRREVQAQVIALANTSPTLEGIKGTRWGAYNAVTEWADHYRPVRGENALLARAEGAIEGPIVRLKDRAWKALASV